MIMKLSKIFLIVLLVTIMALSGCAGGGDDAKDKDGEALDDDVESLSEEEVIEEDLDLPELEDVDFDLGEVENPFSEDVDTSGF